MYWLVAAVALAGRPTPEVLDDLDRWHAGADPLIDGPPGCWELEGDARQVLALFQAPDRFSTATTRRSEARGRFVGRLEDRRWTRFELTRDRSDGDVELELALSPLVGRAPDASEDDDGGHDFHVSLDTDGASVGGALAGMSMLREAIDRWTGSVERQFTTWDEAAGAVRYVREVVVVDGSEDVVAVTSWFPEGAALATRIDAVWPKVFKMGSWPARVTFRDPQMHLRGFVHDGVVLPQAESASVVVGAFGFTVGYEQELIYRTATPCPAAAPEPPPATP